MALHKQELWSQLRDAEAASPRPSPRRRLRLWLNRGYAPQERTGAEVIDSAV